MEKFKIKKNDKVIVIAGKDKGKTGEVKKVIRDTRKVVISGVNVVKKHQKATKESAASIINKELPLAISNVALICPKTNKRTKVGFKIDESGKKVRFAKVSGEIIDI
jgi:large subunit ribosomal protein L24